jgi:addiction module HigA family antidote
MDDEMMLAVHPGEILLHEFLLPMEMTAHRLALCIGVDPRRIHDIIQGKRSVTADTALRS